MNYSFVILANVVVVVLCHWLDGGKVFHKMLFNMLLSLFSLYIRHKDKCKTRWSFR